MYKCLNDLNNQYINILSSAWTSQLESLRVLDRGDSLVCPGCLQPVRVKAGAHKRWHFAHKHLANCPLQRESPELMNARAVLYQRMVIEFGEAHVNIEKDVPGSGLPRPVDVWVSDTSGDFAYWIIESRLTPAAREAVKAVLAQLGVPVNVIFLASLMKVDADPSILYLSTTEREFFSASPYDAAWKEMSFHTGKTIHYLDEEQEKVITYRNLQLIHLPQQHTGRRLETPFRDIQIDPASGEFVHPGEAERLRNKPDQRKPTIRPALDERHLIKPGSQARRIRGDEAGQKTDRGWMNVPMELLTREGTCRICGKRTTRWVQYFGESGECICRDCSSRTTAE